MAEEPPRRSRDLNVSIVLAILGSIMFSLAFLAMLALALFSSLFTPTDAQPPLVTRGTATGVLILTAILGAGAYCGVMGALAARRGSLRRASWLLAAASALPPVQPVALVSLLCLLQSPEWKSRRPKIP